MINRFKTGRITLLCMLLGLLPLSVWAEQRTIANVTVDFEVLADGTAKVKYAVSRSPKRVLIKIDGNEVAALNPGDVDVQSAQINRIAHQTIGMAYPQASGQIMWRYEAPVSAASDADTVNAAGAVADVPVAPAVVRKPDAGGTRAARKTSGDKSPLAMEMVNRDEFFGTDAVADYVGKADSYAKALAKSENKAQFLIDNDVVQFLDESETELTARKEEIPAIAHEAVAASEITDPETQTRTLSLLVELLNSRFSQREAAFVKLQSVVDSVSAEASGFHPLKESVINYSIIVGIVLVLLIWMIIAIGRKKSRAKSKQRITAGRADHEADSDNPAIVVRRRTTSILKKQCIDDVVDNPAYMLINSSEFATDSAVRNIYISNKCIKDVYNLYAEDLRNSSNPKEDGCMVLGRWVQNEDTHTYDISLETVVFPGDDAIFKEYELNFGGKIKLRIAEKLRKLRRETNLQYDLVCWIHSHPGLGVFFSNSDDSVQMQLRHAQHPCFLTAFVVDILTSDQELGIFTFRKDGTMNSKNDLTRLYSLEEMYKWALESDKTSFNPDNYNNILASAKMQMPACKGIELNNSSIIDLTQIVVEPSSGIVGWAVGTAVEVDGGTEYVVSDIVKADEKPTAGVVGVLLNVPHMSLPTIQRLIAGENPSFVMVYSSRNNMLTSIPVINGELITDEHFYGEKTIDDLKIWTRRKR